MSSRVRRLRALLAIVVLAAVGLALEAGKRWGA